DADDVTGTASNDPRTPARDAHHLLRSDRASARVHRTLRRAELWRRAAAARDWRGNGPRRPGDAGGYPRHARHGDHRRLRRADRSRGRIWLWTCDRTPAV